MNVLPIALITYVLSSLLAIAGMGAAGILIPNYVALGLPLGDAILLGLTQNVFELAIATGLNHRKQLITWRNVALVYGPAAIFIPLGFLTHRAVPVIVVMAVFEAFLLYAIYSVLRNSVREVRADPAPRAKVMLLGTFQGYLAGLIGMDAAPIAILAYSLITKDPKKVSGNTSVTALLISATALLPYFIGIPHSVTVSTMLIVGLSGLLGGITGTLLMHVMSKNKVRLAIAVLLVIAAAEVLMKISTLL